MQPSGARPPNTDETNRLPRIESFSFSGVSTPKPSSLCFICSRLKPIVNVATGAYSISSSGLSAAASDPGSGRFFSSGAGTATTAASKCSHESSSPFDHETSQPSAVMSIEMIFASTTIEPSSSFRRQSTSVFIPPSKEIIIGLKKLPVAFFSFIERIAPRIIEPYFCSRFQNGANAWRIESLSGLPP